MHSERDNRRDAAAIAGCLILCAAFYSSVSAGAQNPQAPPAAGQAASRCRVDGRVTSGGGPIPGASVVVHAGEVLKAATSTDIDGKFAILFAPNSSYHITVDLTAFATAERDVTLGAPPCDTTLDFPLTLRPRGEVAGSRPAAVGSPEPAAGSSQSPAGGQQSAAGAPAAGASDAGANADTAGRGGRGGGRGQGGRNAANAAAGGAQGAAAQTGRGAQRFQSLQVQADANGVTLDDAPADDPADVGRLLPAGFSLDAAQSSAVALTDTGDATSLDRGAFQDRLQAIAGGQFDPSTGQFAPAAAGDAFGGGGQGPGGGRGGPGGGRGGPPGGRGAGPGGRGGFLLGGRGARGQSPYQGTVNYTFGGAILNASPFQLNSGVPTSQPQYAQNTAGVTFGGPLKIPGIYKDTNRRTNFQLNYQGNRSNNVVDQYATVPTMAERSGDFSSAGVQIVNPKTGVPFAGNQIPTSAMDPGSLVLLGFIPQPNLPGSTENYHLSTTQLTTSNSLSLRFTQNLSRTVQAGGRGGRGGGRGGFGGGRGGPGGPGRGQARGTTVILNGQLQYRRNDADSVNIFPGLGGHTTTSSITAPIGLNVVRGRTVNNITVNVTHSSTTSTNGFSGTQNVAGLAGIQYPTAASTDPLNWGVPNVTFSSGLTGLRGAGASVRSDDRVTTSYVWSRPIAKHQVRVGADYRLDRTTSESNANARGTFTYTGLYSTGGLPVTSGSGADFADFLLGAPQQAALQVGGTTHLRGKSFDTYIEDNWQKSARLTFNLGLRYELVLPYTEANGQMANLDAAPGFAAVSSVQPGQVGQFTGLFPAGLINADKNNIGPRFGMAYRIKANTILRAGYSVTYNPGSYSTIARQLVAQPPFAATETVSSLTTPLSLENALLQGAATTTGNFGVDKNYQLGQIQTWNATLSHNLGPIWSVVAGYTGVKGADIDLLEAPNRGPAGLLIPTVQPFTWETSDAHSILNSGNFQLLRRLAHGVSGSASYTLSKSMDDSPSLGGGTSVAQDPQNLGAEWGLSNFDRRHQFTGNLLIELPFGANRRWLHNGGFFGNVFGDWSASFVFTAQSGTPLTPRVTTATNVAQGAAGALRADYTGAPVTVSDPSINEFFNTAAFVVPANGTFGDASRNMIIGPGSHTLNAIFVRDLRLGGNRALTLQMSALNLLNTELWGTVDTNVSDGPQLFGHVTTLRPARTITLNARFRF